MRGRFHAPQPDIEDLFVSKMTINLATVFTEVEQQ